MASLVGECFNDFGDSLNVFQGIRYFFNREVELRLIKREVQLVIRAGLCLVPLCILQNFTPNQKAMSRPEFALFSCLLILVLGASCDRQVVEPAPEVLPPAIQLNYDGENVTAPLLPGGVYEAGVLFTPAELAGLDGKQITEVILFVQDVPISATVRFFEGSSNGGPESLVSSQGIRSELVENSWSRVSLSSPVTIDEKKDLWLTLRFELSGDSQTLGCDAGPADAYGDFLFDESDGLWQKLSSRTSGGININWNLRMVAE